MLWQVAWILLLIDVKDYLIILLLIETPNEYLITLNI